MFNFQLEALLGDAVETFREEMELEKQTPVLQSSGKFSVGHPLGG